jgi:hypothetical protein
VKIDILRHKIKVSYDVRFSKKVKWIAVDSDGEINGFSEKPYLKNVKLCGGIPQWLPASDDDFSEFLGSSIPDEDWKKKVFKV